MLMPAHGAAVAHDWRNATGTWKRPWGCGRSAAVKPLLAAPAMLLPAHGAAVAHDWRNATGTLKRAWPMTLCEAGAAAGWQG